MRVSPVAFISSDYQTAITAIEEMKKLLHFWKALQLAFGALARLGQIQIGIEEKAIRALELSLHVLGDTVPLQSDLVQSVQSNRIAIGLHVRRDVLRDTRAAAGEAVSPNLHELVRRRLPGDDRLLVHGDVPGELHVVPENHAVADVAIVRQMDVRHDEALLANRRLERLRGAAIDC